MHPSLRIPPVALSRNFTLGVANGVFFNAGAAFLSGTTVLPLFLSRLGASEATIGALAALDAFGWYLPQALVAGVLLGRRHTMPFYRFVALWRASFIVAVPFLIHRFADDPATLLPLFVVCFSLFALGSGLGGVSFMATVGKVVPTELTGTFFGVRHLIGGLAGIASGMAVHRLLASLGHPDAFVAIFACAACLVTLGLASFALVREPASPPDAHRGEPFLVRLAEGPRLFRASADYRRLFYVKGLSSAYLLMSPFLVLQLEKRGADAAWAGAYLSCHYAGFLASNLAWGPLSRRAGNRVVLAVASALFAAAPLLSVLFLRSGAPLSAYALPFLLLGAGEAGNSVGYLAYTIERSDESNRPAYVGFMNSIVAPFHFLGAAGGLLLAVVPFEAVCLLSAALLAFGARLATRLAPPRTA